MKVSHRAKKLAPLAAAVLLAVGALTLLVFDEDNQQSSYYDYGHLRRQLLAELTEEQEELTEEQIALQESFVCAKRNGEYELSDEREQPHWGGSGGAPLGSPAEGWARALRARSTTARPGAEADEDPGARRRLLLPFFGDPRSVEHKGLDPNDKCCHVVKLTATATGDGAWEFAATMLSPYEATTGWGKYCQAFEIRDADSDEGTVLAWRSLRPHPEWQPFTEPTMPAVIPPGVRAVVAIARDKVDGYCGHAVRMEMNAPSPIVSTAGPPSESSQSPFSTSSSTSSSSTATTIYTGEQPSEPYTACFISSIFGISASQSDKPLDATLLSADYPNYAFLMFTNLVNLDAPGWQKILYFDDTKRRMITISRYPKFMAWKEEFVRENCPVVFYLDGGQTPKGSVEQFNEERDKLLQFDPGFAQRQHWKLSQELHMIVRNKKDTKQHMDDTLAWMQDQPDFEEWEEPKKLWANCWMAYTPNSPTFQQVSQYFWDIYSTEELSWRDQPLWGYTLHHFNVKPLPYVPHLLFAQDWERFGGRKGGHTYDMDAESEVEIFVDKICDGKEKNQEEEDEDKRVT